MSPLGPPSILKATRDVTGTAIALRRVATIVRAVSAAPDAPCVRASADQPSTPVPTGCPPPLPGAMPFARVDIPRKRVATYAAKAHSPRARAAISPVPASAVKRAAISPAPVSAVKREAISLVPVSAVKREAISPVPATVRVRETISPVPAMSVMKAPVRAEASGQDTPLPRERERVVRAVLARPTTIRTPSTI